MIYKTRGPLTYEDSALYLTRPADRELLELTQRMDYVALIGPRLTGKTSLLVRLWETLKPMPRFALAYVNLSLYQGLHGQRWMEAVYEELVSSTDGLIPSPLGEITDTIELREAFLHHLQRDLPDRNLVVLLDDVETVPMEERTPFFSTLREMFVSRGIYPAFRRLTFTLAGSYIPDELIPDPTTSPFRVAEKLYIEDATDIRPLVELLNGPQRTISQDVLPRIMEWTEGDVYLTQRLCERLDHGYSEGHITPSQVDQVVERYLFDDDLLTSLEKKVRANGNIQHILEQVILLETMLHFTRATQAITHTWLMGCIKPNRYNNCTVRNAIYDRALRNVLGHLPTVNLIATDTNQTVEFAPPTLQLPLRGRYRLESTLKRNVLTHIYRARDLQQDKWVVIKQLLSNRGADLIAWRRFQRESEALRQLDHPHIIQWIENFREGDYSYIVMEYMDGGTLDTLLNREGRQPVEVMIPLMIKIADALGYAHHGNIIHRDVKPSNILLNQVLSPKLADFGVAHFAGMAERLTSPYAIIGTPAYLAPEGYDSSFCSPSEDIWSLGVTLFEMLTGFLPFNGRTHEHIRHAVMNDPIPDIHTIRPDVPDNLIAVIHQMLARRPEDRLQDGWAVKRELLAI